MAKYVYQYIILLHTIYFFKLKHKGLVIT